MIGRNPVTTPASFNRGKTVIEDNEVETLEDHRKRDHDKRKSIKPQLKQPGFYRDSRTGRVMEQVKDNLIAPDDKKLRL